MKQALCLVLLSGILLSGCALKQDVQSLNNHLMALSQRNDKLEQRVAELDRQLGALVQRNSELEQRSRALQEQSVQMESRSANAQKSQVENDRQLREQLAELRVTLTDIRQEVQALSGKSEVADHTLKQKAKAVEDLEKKLDGRLAFVEENTSRYQDRISRMEQYLNLDAFLKKTPVKGGAEGPAGKEISEDGLYERAKQSFDKGEYEDARKGFQELLEKYPQSKLANNAQFWIGEIYYREKWYEKAILEYQKVIENFPQGNKVPSALLKQGFAFLNIGDQTNARLILKELMKKYPESNEAKIAEKKLHEIK